MQHRAAWMVPMCFLVGCGSDATLPIRDSNGDEQAAAEGADEDPAEADEASAPSEVAASQLVGVGYEPFVYPEPPFGVQQGQVIENLDFLGWDRPLEVGFDVTTASAVQMSDFYDPDGQKGTELLMISAVAIWCGVCRTEYADMRNEALYQELKPRGLEMLGILFEDNNGDPADYADLVNWASSFGVEFPFVLDPSFKSGVFFDRSATPMNMLIDTRTMQILLVMTGYNPEIYDYVRQVLTERGR